MSRNALLVVAVLGSLLLAGCVGDPGESAPSTTSSVGTGAATDHSPAGTDAATDEMQTQTDTRTDQSRPQVTLRDANGTVLGRVTVAVADNGSERFTGLSETTSLDPNEGMLFVYERPQQDMAYVMRDMDFPLDILFVAPNGTITTIHHAATEPGVSNENLTQYPGGGQYVLEVNRGYTNRTGVSVGDTVEIPATIATSPATPTPGDDG